MDDIRGGHTCIDWLETETEITNTPKGNTAEGMEWIQDSIQRCTSCGRSYHVIAEVLLVPEEE